MFKRIAAALMLLTALALGVAACGGSSDTTSADNETPVAQIDNLTGVQTQVAFDSGFVDALGKLGLTPAPVGKATFKDGAIAFPITGGNVTYYDPSQPLRPYVQGEIDHAGSGLSLTAGKTEVDLTDFVIDPGTSKLMGDVAVNGKSAAKGAVLFDLDGSTLKPLAVDKQNGTATLDGTTVEISDDAANLLNGAFKTNAVQGGTVVGISTITVAVPS